jgi:hypothetical protein
MIPILEEYSQKTNQEISQEIKDTKKINVNFYPIIAKRSEEIPEFKKFLLREMNLEENAKEVFFGSIKISWLPLISILENGSEEFIKSAIQAFSDWSKTEKENFLNYIKEEKDIIKYFKEYIKF